jgi:hypothetical protein
MRVNKEIKKEVWAKIRIKNSEYMPFRTWLRNTELVCEGKAKRIKAYGES